jgi:hypothetical protein
MSYDQKITQVREIVESHNQNVDESDKINFEDFMDKLRKMGGTNEAALRRASWEDIRDCGIPKIMARQFSVIFREDNGDGGTKSIFVSDRKAQSMTIKELLNRYDPRDIKNAVGKRLKELAEGKPCIVFHPNGTVNVDESDKLLKAIRDGYPVVETVLVEGRPTPVYKVGERTDNYAEENPLYPGRVLRPGGICDQTNRSWDGVSLTIRQLLYLSVTETGELEIESVDDAHDALDKAVASDAEKKIRSRYTKASLMFDEQSKQGELPTLRIKLGNSQKGKKANDPFYAHKDY